MTAGAKLALLDIEGTLAPLDFVHRVMFPDVRRHAADFLARRGQEPGVRAARLLLASEAAEPMAADDNEVALRAIERLMDADAKVTGLKQLQGLIWQEGYAEGRLHSQLFADTAPTLRAWHAAGLRLAIYSSGSIAAQKLFFAHTDDGDLTPLFEAHFDTTTGPKRDPASFTRIASALGLPPGDIDFFSDVVAELDAARAVGMQTRLVIRPGNAPVSEGHGHAVRAMLEWATE